MGQSVRRCAKQSVLAKHLYFDPEIAPQYEPPRSEFTSRFPANYHRTRLFDEPNDERLHVPRLNGKTDMPLVSAPERAWLELLSEVGVRQPLSEARDLAESTHTYRARVLREPLLVLRP